MLPAPKAYVGTSAWGSWLYRPTARNEPRATRYFNLSPAQVFGIGTQIEV